MLKIGAVVATSYGSGPYRVIRMIEDCTCASVHEPLSSVSEPHSHLTCVPLDRRRPTKADHCWLNGYRPDGTSVWSSDQIYIGKNSVCYELDLSDRQIEDQFARLGLHLAIDFGDAERFVCTDKSLNDLKETAGSGVKITRQDESGLVMLDRDVATYAIDFGTVRLLYRNEGLTIKA